MKAILNLENRVIELLTVIKNQLEEFKRLIHDQEPFLDTETSIDLFLTYEELYLRYENILSKLNDL